MKKCNLINYVLLASVPSFLSIFFTLETKEILGAGSFITEGGKAEKYLEHLLMTIVQIDLSQKKCYQRAPYREDNRNL
jgi:hypothetical protein